MCQSWMYKQSDILIKLNIHNKQRNVGLSSQTAAADYDWFG